MKKILFYFSFFTVLLFLFTACAVHLDTINQKTIKKCSACEKFLKEDKIYETSYREYDKIIHHGYHEVLDKASPDSLRAQGEASFMDSNEVQYLVTHTFCFIGMKKANVEKRFGKSLGKTTAPSVHPITKKDEWMTVYNFMTGGPDKDGAIYVSSRGGIIFDYEFINGDTLFRASIDDVDRLKKCLDAEGVKYME